MSLIEWVSVGTFIIVVWRMIDGFSTKKEMREIRKTDEEQRKERQGVMDEKIATIGQVTEDTNQQVRRINGSVAKLTAWKEEVASPALKDAEDTKVAVAILKSKRRVR